MITEQEAKIEAAKAVERIAEAQIEPHAPRRIVELTQEWTEEEAMEALQNLIFEVTQSCHKFSVAQSKREAKAINVMALMLLGRKLTDEEINQIQ